MIEQTITQNSGLYFAQHKGSKQRAALFRKLGALARKQHPNIRQQRPVDELFRWPRLYWENGR